MPQLNDKLKYAKISTCTTISQAKQHREVEREIKLEWMTPIKIPVVHIASDSLWLHRAMDSVK